MGIYVSSFIWVFERFDPKINSKEKCFWFKITSSTPQVVGETTYRICKPVGRCTQAHFNFKRHIWIIGLNIYIYMIQSKQMLYTWIHHSNQLYLHWLNYITKEMTPIYELKTHQVHLGEKRVPGKYTLSGALGMRDQVDNCVGHKFCLFPIAE